MSHRCGKGTHATQTATRLCDAKFAEDFEEPADEDGYSDEDQWFHEKIERTEQLAYDLGFQAGAGMNDQLKRLLKLLSEVDDDAVQETIVQMKKRKAA